MTVAACRADLELISDVEPLKDSRQGAGKWTGGMNETKRDQDHTETRQNNRTSLEGYEMTSM